MPTGRGSEAFAEGPDMPAQLLVVEVLHLAEGALCLLVDRASPVFDRPPLTDLVHGLSFGRVELVAVVGCVASLLEPRAQLVGGIGLGPLERAGRPPLEPPDRGKPEGASEPCQTPSHASDGTLGAASCLVSRAPFPCTLAAEAA